MHELSGERFLPSQKVKLREARVKRLRLPQRFIEQYDFYFRFEVTNTKFFNIVIEESIICNI